MQICRCLNLLVPTLCVGTHGGTLRVPLDRKMRLDHRHCLVGNVSGASHPSVKLGIITWHNRFAGPTHLFVLDAAATDFLIACSQMSAFLYTKPKHHDVAKFNLSFLPLYFEPIQSNMQSAVPFLSPSHLKATEKVFSVFNSNEPTCVSLILNSRLPTTRKLVL